MPAHSRNSVKESNLILTEKLHKWVLPALRHARDAMVYTINEKEYLSGITKT